MKIDKETVQISPILNKIDSKIKWILNNPIICLPLIGITALLFRLYFLPNLPFTQDAIAYFQFANDLIILQNFPSSFSYLESGWPTLLSIFISIFQFNNFSDYVYLQRLITILISVITIIPLYLLSKRIFDSKSLACISTILFVFEPHIVNNSLQGISEPLFILISTTAIYLFLSQNQKIMYSSFVMVALLTIVRTQGIILFFIMLMSIFLFQKKEKKMVLNYILIILIFSSIIIPVISLRSQENENDLLVGRVTGAISDITNEKNSRDENIIDIISKGGEVLGKRIFQTMNPYFIIFVPFGIILVFQERTRHNMSIIFTLGMALIFSIYVFWASTDIRNIFWTYPLFAILSVFTLKKISEKVFLSHIILICTIVGIILLSWFYLFSNEIDLEHEKEALEIANYLAENTKVINHYLPESGYLAIKSLDEIKKFPILHTSISPTIPKALEVYTNNHSIFANLEEFIIKSQDKGLTHIVVDKNVNRPDYLKELFYNEKKYPYLEKEFDSRENNYEYHVKIFKIIYEKFDSNNNTK